MALALLAVAQGCEKEPSGPKDTGVPIMLSATESGTKALLENGTFSAKNNQIKIYDYYTPISGQADYYIGVTPDEYIISYGPDQGTWPFVNQKYSWTPDGVHKFFGWLAEDVNMTSTADAAANTPAEFFGDGFAFNTSTQVLTIPAKSMQQGIPQFDFMYSDINERNLTTNPDYATAVPLEFSHLFTAFSVTALNSSSNKIVLKSVTLTNLKDIKSATIDYSAAKLKTGSTPATVAYGNAATSGQSFLFTNTTGLTLTSKAQIFADYSLLWPQTDTELDNASLIVVYDYTDKATGKTTSNVSKPISLSSLSAWDAGQKNNINLVFKDNEIILECVVQPWEVQEEMIEFSDQVSASVKLVPDINTVRSWDRNTGEVILYDNVDMQAVFSFKIDTPKGATWTAALIPIEGHQDAFAFVKDTKYGAVGVESELRLVVTNNAPIAPRHVCKLRITVQTSDGRTIVVKNLMPKNINGETMLDADGNEITEYTIIQNLING